ncbi:MAG: hypothetical protein ACK4OM_06735 [Alphaproteobacteria bacterium]
MEDSTLDSPKVIDQENIEENLKKLRSLILNYRTLCTSKAPQEKLSKCINEISDISKSLKQISGQKEYKLISNKNGIIIWGHPDNPDDLEKQITYTLDKDEKKYIITSGAKAKAYILNEEGKDTELVTIQDNKITHAGIETSFINPKRLDAKRLRIEANQRFEKTLHKKDFSITKPFYITTEQEPLFKSLLDQALNGEAATANQAFEAIYELAISNNTYNYVAKALPYYDKNGDLYFGFDDQRDGRRAYQHLNTGQQISSKYSIAYKIDKNSKRVNILTSTHTSNFYIMAKVGNYIELLAVDENQKKTTYCNISVASNIINFNSSAQGCTSLCGIIRESGNSEIYGVKTYEATQKLIKDFKKSNLLNDIAENQKQRIQRILESVLSFYDTNALVITVGENPLSLESLKETIGASIHIIKNCLVQSDLEIANIFRKNIEDWKTQIVKEENTEKEQKSSWTESVRGQPLFPKNIIIPQTYERILSFNDSQCFDEESNTHHNANVFIYNQRGKDFKSDKTKSFIIEIRKEPYEVRIRLGTKLIDNDNILENSVDTTIEFNFDNKKYYCNIKDGQINFKDNIIPPFYKETPESGTYYCEGCTTYTENSKKLIANFSPKSKITM